MPRTTRRCAMSSPTRTWRVCLLTLWLAPNRPDGACHAEFLGRSALPTLPTAVRLHQRGRANRESPNGAGKRRPRRRALAASADRRAGRRTPSALSRHRSSGSSSRATTPARAPSSAMRARAPMPRPRQHAALALEHERDDLCARVTARHNHAPRQSRRRRDKPAPQVPVRARDCSTRAAPARRSTARARAGARARPPGR